MRASLSPEAAATAAVTEYAHDVFISYSRADKEFARKLEKALEDYRPPKNLAVPKRHLSVFRDESDFTGVEYYSSITTHLSVSEKLLVLCSPSARRSTYVNDEIRRFVARRGAENVIPLLLSGLPNGEARTEQETDMAFPEALIEAIPMPIAADYRAFETRGGRVDRGAFADSWYLILANVYRISRSEIEERDRKRRARRQRVVASIAASMIVALSFALIITLRSQQQAVRAAQLERSANERAQQKQREAEAAALAERAAKEQTLARALAARAELLVSGRGELVEVAGLLAIEAMNRAPSLEADRALRRGLELLPERVAEIPCTAGGEVRRGVFSPDGHQLATVSANGPVTLWDTATGRKGPVLDAGRDVAAIAFHPGRSHVAIVAEGATVWDSVSGRLVVRLAHESASNISYSPDGERLGSVGSDKRTKLWNTADYSSLATMENRGEMRAVALAPDAAEVVAWNREAAEFFRSPGPPAETFALRGRDDFKYGHANGEGTYLARVSPLDFAVSLLDVTSRQSLLFENRHVDATFSRNARYLALASPEWDASVYDLRSCNVAGIAWEFAGNGLLRPKDVPGRGSCRRIAQVRHDDSIDRVALSADGGYLATIGRDGTTRVWETFHGREALRLLTTVHGGLTQVAFSDDGAFLSGWGTGGCRTWRSTGQRAVATLRHGDGIFDVAFNGTGSRAATISQDGMARIWSVPDGRQIAEVSVGRVLPEDRKISLSSDGTQVLIGADGRRWNVERPDQPRSIPAARHPATAVSANWQVDVSADTRALVVRDRTTGNVLTRRENAAGALEHLVISADGRRIAGARSNGIWVWTWRDNRETLLPAPGTVASRLSFDTTGAHLAVVGSDAAQNVVDVWTIDNGQKSRFQHEAKIISAEFDPQGKYPVITSIDRTARIWDIEARVAIAQFLHDADAQKAIFSPDGRYVLSAGGRSDRTARLWLWRPRDLVTEACSRLSRHALTSAEWEQYVGSTGHRPTCAPTDSEKT